MNKVILWINGALVVLVIVLGFIAYRSQSPLGAQSNFSGPLNSAAGYQESGTTIIDTDRNFTVVALNASGAVNASSTATVQGATEIRSSLTLNSASVTSSISHNFGGTTSTRGLILRAANGTCARLGVDNSLQFTTSTTSCP